MPNRPHQWADGHQPDSPDGPAEWFEYCEVCGFENNGEDSECPGVDWTFMASLVALNPAQMLIGLAAECDRTNDAGFWILVSAAYHLRGETDSEPSSAWVMYWSKLKPEAYDAD
jgi:hypothetical protein